MQSSVTIRNLNQAPEGKIVLVPKELRSIYEYKNPILTEKRTYDSEGRLQSEERTIRADSLTVYPLGDSQGRRLELPKFGINP
ncbi:MAG: hypothetical protein M1503_04490 [Thaumarchaeota archaeon]|nr:hypothetical protein [Nitrososphaerota archaeon]MCL5317508.1 hypothetical protein [Nitrososphaerota archaeon]